MKWSVMALLFVGVIAAVCVALLVAMLQAPEPRAAAEAAPEEVTVVVATEPIPAMTRVRAGQVAERTMPVDEAPEGGMRSAVQVIGEVALTPLVEGQPFTRSVFAASGRGVRLAGALEPGKRAVSVSMSDYAGLAGLLYPGARVDVLASFRLGTGNPVAGSAVSTTLLRSVQVLAIDTETIESAASAADEDRPSGRRNASARRLRVTMLVDAKQAEALQLAMEQGSISLAMRNPLDGGEVDRDPTVLSQGRLAQWASFMETTVDPRLPGDEPERVRWPEPEPEPEVEAEPEPAVAEPAPEPDPRWSVTVLRGERVDTQEFPMPARRAAETPDRSE